MVKGMVPDEITFTGMDTVVLSGTYPLKVTLGVCTVSVDIAWNSLIWYVFEPELVAAVITTV